MDKILGLFAVSGLDLAAIAFFMLVWVGYGVWADVHGRRVPSLTSRMGHHRRAWMHQMLRRENRMADVNILQNLATSAQFFASTTMLILGALVALMGYTEKVVDVVAELPFTQRASQGLWEIKVLLLLTIFTYTFFKFTWSIRQYGFVAILVGATPPRDSPVDPPFVERAARVLDSAGHNYNNGLRGYYFGMAALASFLHSALMIVSVLIVVGILYHREFRSRTLQALAES